MKQDSRSLQIQTPLGADVLLLTAFRAYEQLADVPYFDLELVSDDGNISAADIVGKQVSFSAKYLDDKQRHFHGFVRTFMAGPQDDKGRRNYRARVVPWVWCLSRTTDCRIFQSMNVPAILEKVFQDLGFTNFRLDFRGDHPQRDFCVQYRETDLNFVRRLCEEEGIFWIHKYKEGEDLLYLADHVGAYFDCPQNVVDFPRDIGSHALEAHITSWMHHYDFRSGKVAQHDYNFEKPSDSLMTNEQTVIKLSGPEKYELYDYPGEYAIKNEGQSLSRLRMEEEEAWYDLVEGQSVCATFTPGGTFQIREHQAKNEQNKQYVLTRVVHEAREPFPYETGATGGAVFYQNEFTCIPKSVVYRPPRETRKPIVQGVQTAVVVGPPGEEIYTDKYGRVKVQFHWDREGKKDEKSSCWMRVAQVHAGKGFGGIDIPRMGEEVIVSFLEGDPDRPLITGRVYHAENMPPYTLPDQKVVSGLKSKTYKGEGYNELAMDDTKGKELIRIHAQYDMDTTVKHDDRQQVDNDRTIGVDGKHTETIKKDTTIKITEGNLVHRVETGTATIFIKSDVKEDFDATQKTTVTKEVEVTSKGAHVHVTASTQIHLKVGLSELLLKSDGSIKLTGKNITIDGSESVTIHGASVTSNADQDHNIKGAIVKSEGASTNTVKGGMVMLNP